MTFLPFVRRFFVLVAGAALLVFASPPSRASVLLRYEMNQTAPDLQDPVNGLEGSSLLPGEGVGTFILPSTQPYPSAPPCVLAPAVTALPMEGADAALAAGCFVYFDFRVGPSVGSVDIQALTLDAARGGANTNRGFGVFVTTPAIVDVLVKSSTPILTQRYVWDPRTIDLSGVESLQNLKPGDVVRVKIPFWTADASQSSEMDNITVLGVAHPASEGPPPLILTQIERQDQSISIGWQSQTGRFYAVECSTDLMHWEEMANNIPAGPGFRTSVTLNTADPSTGSDRVVLQYQMGQLGPHVQDPARTVAGGDLVPGPGLGLFNVEFTQYASSPALTAAFAVTTPDAQAAVASGSLFSFDLTVGTNVADLSITRLTFNAARGGGSTPRGYCVYVNTPATVNQLVKAATDVTAVRPNWAPQELDLSGILSLQNLRAGQSVRFTIPVYSPARESSVELDDLTVWADVSPRPVPAYVDANKLYLRIREMPGEPILVEAASKPSGVPWNWQPTRTLAQLPGYLSAAQDGATSVYGGALAFRTNATGYFYPLKVDGRWWFVDPLGYLFLHKGVAVVTPLDSSGAKAALTARFGNEGNWAVATTTLLRQQGFNGAGSWSDNGNLKRVPQPLARTGIANFLKTFASTNTNPGYPQVFDPTFQPFCNAYAKQFQTTRNEASLIGYYSDNELNFPSSMLATWLGLPAGDSSSAEAWRWLRERYGPGATASQVTSQDRLDFLGHVWGRYYSVVNQAIKSRDPNHLYLGSRFFSTDKDRPEIFRAIGPHVDVISVNHYSQWTPDIERIQMWERESGRPVMITEFYVKGEDSGMPNYTGAGWVVRTQKDRGHFYQNFVLALIESRVCIGWHWFRYADNDPEAGEDPSNVDSNKGVVSNRYEPYEDLLEDMRLINARTHRLTEYFDGR